MAKRRSKKEDMLAYPYTPERQLEHPSGWCMTQDHDGCKYQFSHGKCGCDCHIKTQKTQKTRKKIEVVADSNDPRPWRNNG